MQHTVYCILHSVASETLIMNKIILISIVCLFFIADVKCQTTGWSSWADCAKSDGCFRRRILTCDVGEGLKCLNDAGGAFEQRALNCTSSPECLEDVTEMLYASEVSACSSSFILFCIIELQFVL